MLTTTARISARGTLDNLTAAGVMTPNPVSVRENATLAEAVRFLTDKGVSGAVVIGDSGRPVGVITESDILVHERERLGKSELMPLPLEGDAEFGDGTNLLCGPTFVSEVMTPIVFTVRPEERARKVVEQMIMLNVHRLFVVDETGVVIGVISALDVLRHIC